MPDFLDSKFSFPLLVLWSAALAELLISADLAKPQRLGFLCDIPTTQTTQMINLALRIDEYFLLFGLLLVRRLCSRFCSSTTHGLLLGERYLFSLASPWTLSIFLGHYLYTLDTIYIPMHIPNDHQKP